jgi:hypothetical protein
MARGVGRKRLVDEDELLAAAVDEEPKLKVGVGNDESARGCVLRSGTVQLQCDVGNSVIEICTDESRRRVVPVCTSRGLRRGVGEGCGLGESG